MRWAVPRQKFSTCNEHMAHPSWGRQTLGFLVSLRTRLLTFLPAWANSAQSPTSALLHDLPSHPWNPCSQRREPGRDRVLTGAQWWSGQSRWRGRRARHMPRRHRIGHPPAWSTERTGAGWVGGGTWPCLLQPPSTPDTLGTAHSQDLEDPVENQH